MQHPDPHPSQTVKAGKTLIMKFGGTSVGSTEAMAQAAEIACQARNRWPRLVVVVSALSGVTDLLLESARRAAGGDTAFVLDAENKLGARHGAMFDALIGTEGRAGTAWQESEALINSFGSACRAMAVLGEATPRSLDSVAGLGERLSARILAAAIQERGLPATAVEATDLIVTDDRFQDAHPDLEATRRRTAAGLGPVLDSGVTPVVTGFIAATSRGVHTTLGRGGSDYTAALIGAALDADDVWIWTDVDGVMSADPRLAPHARTIPELTYREISELAYYGAKVLHPKTIRPVIEAGIGLRVCNTFNPAHPGTRLVADSAGRSNGKIKAVTAIRGQRLVTIEGRGMLGVPGVAARAFGAVASTGTSVPLITQASSEQSICFAVQYDAADQVMAALEEAFRNELARRDIDQVWATDEVFIVTVVGAGMRHQPGIAGRIFSALGQAGLNVIAIAQGSSEVSISLVVNAGDGEAAVRALHTLALEKNDGKEG